MARIRSSPIPARARPQRAFTLVELLVVVLIIALFAGIAVLSVDITGEDREIESEFYRMQGLLGLMREEALLQNLDYGFLFIEDAYRIYVFDNSSLEWVPPRPDELLEPRALGEPLKYELWVEGTEIALQEAFYADMLESPNPQVVVSSTGEMTPFELGMYRDIYGGRYYLDVGIDGTMEVTQEGYDDF